MKEQQPNINAKPIFDTEIEKVVLGAILTEKGAELIAMSILSVDSFYSEQNALIYKAICQLSNANKPIDIFTVTEQVTINGDLDKVGGAYYIATLTEKVGSALHLEYHAKIVQQKFLQRELLKIGNQLVEKSTDPTEDVDDIFSFAEKSIFDLSTTGIKNQVKTSDDILRDCVNRLQNISDNPNALTGVPSGFTDLDRITGGWQNSDLIIVAGRPSMGKTAFVMSMARNITVDFDMPLLIFSLEMSDTQLMNRLIAQQTGVNGAKINKGKLDETDWRQLDANLNRLSNLQLYIDCTAGISLFELRTKAIKEKQKHNISCIIIDYLQLMTISNRDFKGNREQEISTISRGLKQIAKDLNVPIIVLSQLSRTSVNGGDPTPKLHHLRDSGAIEQDADIVTFIHRPEYYGIAEDENGNSTENLAQIIIAKNRNGATDTINLKFVKELAKFENENQF